MDDADLKADLESSAETDELSAQRKIHSLTSKNRSLREAIARLRQHAIFLEGKQRELVDLLNHDQYTALPIRRVFDRQIDERFRAFDGGETNHRLMAIGVIRLDKTYARIKNTRDRNKILLFRTTARIKGVIGENLFQSDRLDEFHIILNNMPNMAAVELMAERIAEDVARPHEAPADDVSFGCYLGIAVYPAHGRTRDELLGNADIALTQSELLDTPYVIYDEGMGRQHRDRETIEADLQLATQNGFEQFRIHYQPFVDDSHRIIGAEALLRWHHPTLGNIPPQAFIPIAEQTGDIRILGQWVLYNACKQLVEWHRLGYPEMYISVNLSAYQFKQRDVVERVTTVLNALRLNGRHLKLELTESMLMEDPEDAIRKMVELKKIGVRFSIDDFGTGYSSLNYLRKFPIDMVKVDKSFVDDVHTSVSNQEIVKAIISLVHTIHVDCLAEGVEHRAQVDFLFQEGCDAIQGFYFSRPVEPDVVLRYLQDGGRLGSAPGVEPTLTGPISAI